MTMSGYGETLGGRGRGKWEGEKKPYLQMEIRDCWRNRKRKQYIKEVGGLREWKEKSIHAKEEGKVEGERVF